MFAHPRDLLKQILTCKAYKPNSSKKKKKTELFPKFNYGGVLVSGN